MERLVLVGLAGLLAGAMNALAGGGSFVSLPALIAVGAPSVSANATSTVALFPGGLAGAYVYRKGLAPIGGVSLAWMLAVTVAGGLAGGSALLLTPGRLFDRLLPWLLLAATLALAGGPGVRAALARRGVTASPALVLAVQFVLGLYGGYFGGAVGLMMMAAWALLAETDMARIQAVRTLMVSAANAMAVGVFALAGVVAWGEAAALGAGALAGGILGARVGRRLPGPVLRIATLVFCAAMTAVFFVRQARA